MRQVDVQGGAFVLEELVWQLNEDAGAVTSAWVGAARTSMAKIN
jgi:hypothetical protein